MPSPGIEGIVPECLPGMPAFQTGSFIRAEPSSGTETSHGPSREAWAFTRGFLSPGQAGGPAALGLGWVFLAALPESMHRNYYQSVSRGTAFRSQALFSLPTA